MTKQKSNPSKNIFLKVILIGLERLVFLALAATTVKILANYFSMQDYGSYQYALAILAIATTATWLVPNEVLYSSITTKHGLPEDYISNAVKLRTVISIVTYTTIAALLAATTNKSQRELLFCTIILTQILIVEPCGVFKLALDAKDKLVKYSITRIILAATRICLLITLSTEENNEYLMLATFAAEQITFSTIIAHIYLKDAKSKSPFHGEINLELSKKILRDGIKYLPSFLIGCIYLKMDRILLKETLNTIEYSTYAAAANIIEQITGIGLVLIATLAPNYIYTTKERTEQTKRVTYAIVASLLFGILISAACNIISPFAVKILLGEKYFGTETIINHLSLLIPLLLADAASNTYLFKNRRTKTFLAKQVIGVTVLLISAYAWNSQGWKALLFGYLISLTINISLTSISLKRNND